MAIFNSYVKLPEGNSDKQWQHWFSKPRWKNTCYGQIWWIVSEKVIPSLKHWHSLDISSGSIYNIILDYLFWHFIWHSFWLTLYYIWHSIWHLFWHSLCSCPGPAHVWSSRYEVRRRAGTEVDERRRGEGEKQEERGRMSCTFVMI